jgi:2-(3-amino-3-carboxypropyl)histidine synthase
MPISSFNLEEKQLAKEVRKHKAKRVLLQLPDGLKPHTSRLVTVIENTGAQAFVSADPCYGACDLAIHDAQAISADLIVHYGHTRMVESSTTPVVYFEAKAKANIKATVKKALPLLKSWESIGLVTTVQHVHKLSTAKDVLLKQGKTVTVGDAGRLKYAGQVIGCDYSNAKAIENQVNGFLFIGGGKFHAVGVSIATSKPTIVADPYENQAYSIEKEAEKIRKQRMASILEAKNAKTYGILIGLKPGQKRVSKAVKVKEKLENKGKKAVLLVLKEISPEALTQFPDIDIFVNTACPRLVLDDSPRFSKPMLSINETLVAIEEIDWEMLCRKGWFEN